MDGVAAEKAASAVSAIAPGDRTLSDKRTTDRMTTQRMSTGPMTTMTTHLFLSCLDGGAATPVHIEVAEGEECHRILPFGMETDSS